MSATGRYDWASLERAVPDAARRLRLDHRQVSNYKAKGLAARRADELAVRLGLHPASVWPSWGEDVLERQRSRRRAQQAAWARRKYRSDPDHRERKRDRDRAYAATNEQARRVATRRYREAHRDEIAKAKRDWWERTKDEQNARRRERYARTKNKDNVMSDRANALYKNRHDLGVAVDSGGSCPSDPHGDRGTIG